MAVPQLPQIAPSEDLLAYYRRRIADFDKERQELLKRVEECAGQRSDVHRLDWENRKRSDEVRELQQALSNSHTYLFEERERLLALQAENDELRLQEAEDRRRIKHLLALTQPTQQEITYQQHGRPKAVTAFARGPGADAKGAKVAAPGAQGRVLRTVFLPTVNNDSLMLRVETLQTQLAEQKQFAAERVGALLQDRKIRQDDFDASQAAAARKLDEMAARLKKAEDTLQHTTHDLIIVRREKLEAEDRAATLADELREEKQRAKEDAVEVRRQASKEVAAAQAAADERVEEYSETLRSQVNRREAELADLEAVHAAMKAQLEQQNGDLTSRLAKAQEANKRLEMRRALDMEGWSADVTLLRKQLAAAERKLQQMRLTDRLPDDERLDALLEGLSRRAPDLPPSRPSTAAGQRAPRAGPPTAGEVAADLRRVKAGIGALNARVRVRVRRASD